MAYYVGLDVSVKGTSICIMDDKGVVAARTDVSTDPDLIAHFISKHALEVERVVHESGILAIWLTRELEKRGVPIICIDARLAHKALSGRINKSDQAMLKDWLSWRERVGSLRSISAAKLQNACASSLALGNG